MQSVSSYGCTHVHTKAVQAMALKMADVKELPKLPYSYDALEPYIDAKTMEVCAVCTVHAAGSTSSSARRCSKGSTALLRASQLLHCPSLSGAGACCHVPAAAKRSRAADQRRGAPHLPELVWHVEGSLAMHLKRADAC